MKKVFFASLSCLLLAGRAAAQLPADQESHHKVVFENNTIRVLEGRVPPGDTTPAHVHAANGVVVFLSQSVFSIELVGGKPVASSVKPGDLKYVNYGDKPVNHRVWADSGGVFHFFVVELKQQQVHADSCGILTGPAMKVLWTRPGIRAYALEQGSGERYSIPKSGCPYLVVGIAGKMKLASADGTREVKAEEFAFFSGNSGVEMQGAGYFLLLSVL